MLRESQHAADGGNVGWDGNDAVCASCGVEGELVCCDSCPRAYQITMECLGGPDAMPPVRLSAALLATQDDEDDAQWFCPACTMETRLATSSSSKFKSTM